MDIIDKVLQNEDASGTGVVTNDPSDSGGKTQWGITEKNHPEAWADGVVTKAEARGIYEKVYVLAEKFNLIPDEFLRHQITDFGVTAGPNTAAKLLQQVVGVAADGELGEKTLAAIAKYPAGMLFGVFVPGSVLLNLAFRDARTMHYASLAKRRPKDLKFLLGWINRTQEFK